MTTRSALYAYLVAYFGVVALGRPLIAFLRRSAMRQIAYEDAPQTHQAKTGTPTMGGLLFVLAPLAALAFAPGRATAALAALVYACMAIGAADDLAAIRHGKNRGLRAAVKFALTALAALPFFLLAGPSVPSLLFVGAVAPWIWYALSVCVILATTHAVNLTDGLDGLAAGAIVPPLAVVAFAAWRVGQPDVTVFAVAMLAAALGFLRFNRRPASVFMGDTGSLALGAGLAGVAILSGAHLLLLVVGGVFAAETLSVIIQVVSYKTTHRRVFRMSPLHHHFELGGLPEAAVTTRFWIASLVLSLLGAVLIARTT